jgi:hypothetical protein
MGRTRVETKTFLSIFRENYFNIIAQIVCETIQKSRKLTRKSWRKFSRKLTNFYFSHNLLQKRSNCQQHVKKGKTFFANMENVINDIRDNQKCIFLRKRNFFRYKKFRNFQKVAINIVVSTLGGVGGTISNWRTEVSWRCGFFTL